MQTTCTIDLASYNGEHTNYDIIITKSPYKGSKGCLILEVVGDRLEIPIKELESACRVMRALQGGSDEDTK